MRYKKGSVALSDTFDFPLLMHARNARCIGREQMRELLGMEMSHLAQRRLAWRMDRLVTAGYLDVLDERIQGDRIYSMTRKGLRYLEMRGQGLVSIHSSMEKLFDPAVVMHALDLVTIRLMLQRSGMLDTWYSEAEISSENIETGNGYAKDYDAVASLRVQNSVFLYGIEYERTTKAHYRYRELRERMLIENRLHGILYFVRDTPRDTRRLFTVATELGNAHAGILFCDAESFFERGADAIFLQSVVEPGASLREMLELPRGGLKL